MKRHILFAIVECFVLLAVFGATVLLVGCTAGTKTEMTQSDPPASASKAELDPPASHRSFYRSSGENGGEPATIPPVFMTDDHKSLCRVGVGDKMPELALQQLGGRSTNLAELFGPKATVVVFWKAGGRMALTELADLGPDVVDSYKAAGVEVVGIAVGETANRARAAVRQAGAAFPILLDADGAAFAKVGSEKLPRTFLLDPSGKVLWFDIEYSPATRRELAQSLAAVAGQE